MSDKPTEWQEEVVIDSPVKVTMHYFGTEAEQAQENEVDTRPVRHGFILGENGYLLPPDCYAELVNRPPICAIPDTPPAFLGFINHRGDTVPVFHLARLDDAKAEAVGKWVLLVGRGNQSMGILLTAPPERLREDWLQEPDEVELPAGLKPCLGNSYRRGLQLWTEFDHHVFGTLVRQQFRSQ